MSTFFAYRVFMRLPAQKNLFEVKKKEEHFKDLFFELKDNHKAKFSHFGSELYMYFVKCVDENIHIWHLAKKQEFVKPMAGDEHIEKVKDEQYPFLHLIFDIKNQIVLIEKNTTVFQQIDTVKNKVETYINICLAKFEITASLIEITDKREFWNKINDFDIVTEIELDYNPPNFFGTHKSADKLVKDVHEETNFEKFRIYLQNKVEGLNFKRKSFGEHISRLSSGAGRYVIKGVVDGFDKTVQSITSIYSKQIENIDEKNEQYWKELFDKINDLNKEDNEQ